MDERKGPARKRGDGRTSFPRLEAELDGALEDTSRVGGGRNLTKGRGTEGRCTAAGACERPGRGSGGCIEIGVVEEVEGFETKLHGEAFPDGEDAGDLGVELVHLRAAEGVATDVSVGAWSDR